MCDIIFSVAWECGDKDCKVQWHKASYWIDNDGHSVDNYSDGDHESIEESDLPSYEEVDQSWRDYAKHVLRTGNDPLAEYIVNYGNKVRERWQFKFNDSVIGPVLVAARNAGRDYTWRSIPEHVKRYLRIGDRARVGDFATWKDLLAAVPTVKSQRWQVFHLEHIRPRKAALVARDLKRIARRQLKSKLVLTS